jgi:hypothetical protein
MSGEFKVGMPCQMGNVLFLPGVKIIKANNIIAFIQ